MMFSVSLLAAENGIRIPLGTIKKPANDLIHPQYGPIDMDQAAQLSNQGQDLSLLDPVDNKIWQSTPLSSDYDENKIKEFPSEQDAKNFGVQYISTQTLVKHLNSKEQPFGTRGYLVKYNGKSYRLTLSVYSYAIMMRAKLLRKLGFIVSTPKKYAALKIKFSSEEQKIEFINSLSEVADANISLKEENWILDDNKEQHTLTIRQLILSTVSNEYFDLELGSAPDPSASKSQSKMVQRLSQLRAWRALIVPYVLPDLLESVNRFSVQSASRKSGFIVLNHPTADAFYATSYEDIRWILRRLQRLTNQDFRDIVFSSQLPEGIDELVYRKLIKRTKNMLETFDLSCNLDVSNLKFDSKNGFVKDGKVVVERIVGYPQRWSHGDREDPYKNGDFRRFLILEGKNTLLANIFDKINEKLQILSAEDLSDERKNEIQRRIAQHLKTNPLEPLYQKVEWWGGPVAGFDINASRHVATGAYNGSTSPVQLVDSFSVGASIGYYNFLAGYTNHTPVNLARVSYVREFTHVRPISSISEGSQISWGDVVVPRYFYKFTEVLSDPKAKDQQIEICENGTCTKQTVISKEPALEFLSNMKEGEVLTITDSLVASDRFGTQSSLTTLVGIDPLSFNNSVNLMVDINKVNLWQTQIIRTQSGIQVFVRDQGLNTQGIQLDANLFLNILNERASRASAGIDTKAFVINTSELSNDVKDKKSNRYEELRIALLKTIRNNNPQRLEENFTDKMFLLEHELKEKENKLKLGPLRSNSFSEDHHLSIIPPSPRSDNKVQEDNEEYLLYAAKKGELRGTDWLGMIFDTLTGWLLKIGGVFGSYTSDNPGNVPLGAGYWRTVTTETDLTTFTEAYPSVSLSERVWGGWKLNKDKFLTIVQKLSDEFKKSGLIKYDLIDPDLFINVKKIEFYRIRALLTVLPQGLDKIASLILQTENQGKVDKARGLSRVFQKISDLKSHGSKADKILFAELLKIYGGGDFKRGKIKYNQDCSNFHQERQDTAMPNTGTWLYGQYYECLLPWTTNLIKLSKQYPKSKDMQAKWMTEILWIIDTYIPLADFLKWLGEENYNYIVQVNGFRIGDEDGDLEFFSNSVGDATENLEVAGGLFNLFSQKTGISSFEIDRTLGGYR